MNSTKLLMVMLFLSWLAINTAWAQLPAFPGAEGFGATTTHGRGGQVLEVTNLNDTGPGSLRAAIETPGKRIIIFRVGGVIQLDTKLNILDPYCMIAGQTAPGDGICLKGSALNIATHDVVVRYLRIRPGDGAGENPEDRDGIGVYPFAALEQGYPGQAYNIVIDHCSTSWSIDENVSFYGSLFPRSDVEVRDITLQWTIVSEALEDSSHPKGPHSKGILVAGGAHRISMHHNLLGHNVERNPLFKTGTNADLVNNVLCNAPGGIGFVDEDNGAKHPNPSSLNLVGNIAIEGPNTQGDGYILKVDGQYLKQKAKFYLEGNISKNRNNNSQDEWAGVDLFNTQEKKFRANQPALTAPAVTTSNAFEAYDNVLAQAGATVPARDAVDTRVVSEVESRTGSFIDSPAQVGGYPAYSGGTAPADTDQDGMSDAWEVANGLNKNDASDRNGDANGNGYTNVEEYLNELVAGGTTGSNGLGTGLKYALYSNKSLSGSTAASGTDAKVCFNWQSGGKAAGLPSDNFSVRWVGQVQPEHSETYTFYTQADDGTRLWVNGTLLIDDWTNHAVREKSGKITLQAGQKYAIKLEYFENGGKAVCKLLWSSPSQSKQVIPSANLFAPNVNSARSLDQPPVKLNRSDPENETSGISLFPNPSTQGAFTVRGLSENSQIRMYDIQGRAVPVTQQVVSEQQVQLLPDSALPSGLYVVQIRQPNGKLWQRKVVVGE